MRRVALLTVIAEIREKTESSIPNIFNNYFLKPSLVIISKMGMGVCTECDMAV